jgi:hypothetical protein
MFIQVPVITGEGCQDFFIVPQIFKLNRAAIGEIL